MIQDGALKWQAAAHMPGANCPFQGGCQLERLHVDSVRLLMGWCLDSERKWPKT
jgi:hypothetical protein